MPRTVYNQKSNFLLVGSGTTTTYSPSNTEFSFIKVFQYILKSIKTFLFQNYFYNNAKKYKQDKKDLSIEKYKTIFMKFKIRIF